MSNSQLVKKDVFDKIKPADEEKINRVLAESLKDFNKKIIALDDDPTGTQTVHNISVYTDWTIQSLEEGFKEDNSLFYVLTNSRSFTNEETTVAHTEIAKNILQVSKKMNKDFIIISRGDSTLRGHYPLETETMKDALEANSDVKFDGEVLFPFFKEGGRFTMNNIHYVQEEDLLTPAGETEFAKDKTFGYTSSNLGDYIEEKSVGRFKAKDTTYISLDSIRNFEIDKIADQLRQVKNFNKVVVNAIDYSDVKVFAIALVKTMKEGKKFMFRTAAAFTKVMGGVSDKNLLTREDLITTDTKAGGIIIVGSHIKKTTEQLEELKTLSYVTFLEFNQHLVLQPELLEKEVARVVAEVEKNISAGNTVAVYTRRDRMDLGGDKKEELVISVKISDAVTSIVQRLNVRPSFIVAKGGITSSDIATKGLGIKKALVMGQIKPGIPVWMSLNESKFPGQAYVVFPGNVGTKTTLKEVVEILSAK